MLRRVLAVAALLMLVVAAATPSGVSQPQSSVVQDGSGATVITVRIPVTDGQLPDDGEYEVPTADGLLLIDLDPIVLPGPGGSVDVDAYLADVQLLVGGVLHDLPSLLIIPEDIAPEGSSDAAMQELEDALGELTAALDELAAETEGEAAWAHAEILAALAEAEWIEGFGEEASGAGVAGLEGQRAILNSMLARIERALPLLRELLDGVNYTLAYATPEVPEEVWATLDEVNATLDESQAKAEAVRDELLRQANENITAVDEMVDKQALIDGALVAIQAAYDALFEEEAPPEDPPEQEPSELERQAAEAVARADSEAAGAQEKVAALQAEVERRADRRSDAFQNRVNETLLAIDEALAPMMWAQDWTRSAIRFADDEGSLVLADASASLTQAIATLEAMRAVVEKYKDQDLQPPVDAQLAQAEARFNEVNAELDAAQAQLEEARAELDGLAGGLDLAPEEHEPPQGDPAQGEDTIAICFDQPTSIVCAEFLDPDEADRRQLVLVVTIPNIVGLLPGFPLPIPTATVPSPTLTVPTLTLPPSPTLSLPGGTPSSSSSAAVSSSVVSSSQASQPSSSAPNVPGLGLSASPDSIHLDEGQQGVLLAKVRNTAQATNRIYLSVRNDAPLAVDASQESLLLGPGEEGEFALRLTPLSAGTGTVTLLASGENGAATSKEVPVRIVAAPVSSSQIAGEIEPTRLETVVGRESTLTVRLSNNGPAAETVSLKATGDGASVEPRILEVSLAPGESAVREFGVTPTQAGHSLVQVRMQTEGGADLEPVMMIDAAPAAQSVEDPSPSPSKPDGGRSPGLAVPIMVVVLATTLLVARRRLR